ncbi:MAG: FliI/YscN family ATPase [Gracilibacteraceae bacterium]|jgi:flagellum-specific ATP synthase|nr:FliI/YscN family ATPase [Gracilibacteraceae bacterium]
MMATSTLPRYRQKLKNYDSFKYMGVVDRVAGLLIQSIGPEARMGDVCRLRVLGEEEGVMAEVVGIQENRILLMPYDDVKGIGLGSSVENLGGKLRIPVGEGLKGRIVNGVGQVIDGKGPLAGEFHMQPAERHYANPLARPRITDKLTFGVKAIDSLLTIGKGQRMGIFSGSGIGKSTLMGMIARNISADVNVIALVGERGREVLDFIGKDLGEDGMRKSVLVVATSDQPAMMRSKCAVVATAIAEYFQEEGRDVLLMMDSLTRFAMAQREIGLAVGEPPVSRGYPPSIYADLPKLLERSGNFTSGSITGIYTVLVEGDDTNEPISDTVRGILDGHIILSRALAQRNHYPPIDIGMSISRLMNDIVAADQLDMAQKMRELLAVYYANYDIIAIGAYKKGSNPRVDRALRYIDRLNAFLRQEIEASFTYDETLALMAEALEG